MPTDVNTTAAYNAVMDKYAKLQDKAYKSADVDRPMLEEFSKTLTSYLDTYVDDAATREQLKSKFSTDMESMGSAIDKQQTSGERSDASWDSTRQDIESLFASMAPEGATAVYVPAGAKSSSTPASTTGTHAVTPGGGNTSTDADIQSFVAAHPEAAPYVDMAVNAGASFNPPVPARTLLGQLYAESNFNPKAVGHRGEKGMSQFTTGTWAAYGAGGDPFNPQDAIMAQARYMSALIKENGGNMNHALMAYNGWEFDKSFEFNTRKGCSPTYVQDITGQSYDQRNPA